MSDPGAASKTPKLSIQRPGQPLEEFELSKSPILVGRVKSNDIVILGDPAISREHCRFDIDPETGTVSVRDLGSSNSTFVNGQASGKQSVVVGPGDKVQVGATIMIYSVDRPSQGAIVRRIHQKRFNAPMPPQENEERRTIFGDGVCTCGRCGATISTKNFGPGEKVGCARCRAVWTIPVVKHRV